MKIKEMAIMGTWALIVCWLLARNMPTWGVLIVLPIIGVPGLLFANSRNPEKYKDAGTAFCYLYPNGIMAMAYAMPLLLVYCLLRKAFA